MRRLQNKIKWLKKDLILLELLKDKEVRNVKHWQTLEKKIRLKILAVVIGELKQRIVAIAAKVMRYQERTKQNVSE